MKSTPRCWTVALLCALSFRVGPNDLTSAEKLTENRFRELHRQLQPGDEPWRTIPWKIDLLDAQRTAAAARKPIFIWAMDGHPLGCT